MNINKYVVLGLISIFYINLFSQSKIDTTIEKVEIPFLLIVDDTIKTSFTFSIIFDTTNFKNNLFEKYLQNNEYKIVKGSSGVSLKMLKNEFETLNAENPKIILCIDYIDDYDFSIRHKFEFVDSFRNLIDIDFNVLEIKTTKKNFFRFRYISNKFEKKYKWKQKYSKLTF